MKFPTKLFVKNIKVDEIVLKDGFRFIKPYTHTFQMWVKQRWIGKTLQEIYLDEFTMPNEIAVVKQELFVFNNFQGKINI